MNILFIDGIEGKAKSAVNLGLGFLAQYLRKKHFVKIVSFEHFSTNQMIELATKHDLIGFSCITDQFSSCLKLAQEIRRRKINSPIIFGGVHPTADPENVMQNKEINFVCVGEGELCLDSLLDVIQSGNDDLTNVPGLCYRNKNGTLSINDQKLIENIDIIGMPAWDLLPLSKTTTVRNVITSRGCPYRCSYCYNSTTCKHFKRPYRRRSVKSVIAECLLHKSTNTTYIAFSDDLFLMDQKWLTEFAKEYKKNVGIRFGCSARPEMVLNSLESLKELKQAGLGSVWIGIESGNERIRREILDRKMKNDDIIRAFKLVKDIGLNTKSFNMIGIPTEGFKEAWDTFAINLKAKPTGTSYYTLIPYPGTKIAEMCKDMGLFVEECSKINDDVNIQTNDIIFPGIINTGKMNRYHIVAFRYLWRIIFTRHASLPIKIGYFFSAFKSFIKGFYAS